MQGFVTKVPTEKLNQDTEVCTFTICNSRESKTPERKIDEANFVQVEARGKLAKSCKELEKSTLVRVVGCIKQTHKTDAKGMHHEQHRIVAEHVDIVPYEKNERIQLNTLIIEGQLTENPEKRTVIDRETKREKVVCFFQVSNKRSYKKKGVTHKEDNLIIAHTEGAQANNCLQYLRKGSPVRVVGRIKQNRWEDATGEHQERHFIVAEHVDFLQAEKKQEKETQSDLPKMPDLSKNHGMSM